jgi:hypothetical protein
MLLNAILTFWGLILTVGSDAIPPSAAPHRWVRGPDAARGAPETNLA